MKGLLDMEKAMTEYFEQHRSEAGIGLELLPGSQTAADLSSDNSPCICAISFMSMVHT